MIGPIGRNSVTNLISEAIDSYAVRAGAGRGAAPYNSESLAEIYAPRVQELFELQAQGYQYAEWKWDSKVGENHWHGVRTHQVSITINVPMDCAGNGESETIDCDGAVIDGICSVCGTEVSE